MDISTIRQQVALHGARIDAPAHLLSIFDASPEDGTPHIEIGQGVYFYIVSERGLEIERRETHDGSTLLYWLMCRIVSIMAMDRELRDRHPAVDFRRQLFSIELKLLAMMEPEWERNRLSEIEKTLILSPFSDRMVLELRWNAGAGGARTNVVLNPLCFEVEAAADCVFAAGGFVRLRTVVPEGSEIRHLSMEADAGFYRLTVLTAIPDRARDCLEWWGGDAGGEKILVNDHPWDPRTVAQTPSAAKEIFGLLLRNPLMKVDELPDFRSPWCPLP